MVVIVRADANIQSKVLSYLACGDGEQLAKAEHESKLSSRNGSPQQREDDSRGMSEDEKERHSHVLESYLSDNSGGSEGEDRQRRG